ncbi:ethylbenzene dehydrogenase-related protein [Maritimibacter sp. DP1N21-5]|uniref:ethylbenzene dehydrogenase-related protein n=1 Tax=Maritimibacter sp. DP1N21-5 TaxID=2836867 RepID=UPI001C46A248|nr:ethylbenzene dehydrogenase-related protein [Maritimibacter sp. DP1N21-5]MBV7407798.1 hypothetical protein [Maritimibacter sp. DP1N21-5]
MASRKAHPLVTAAVGGTMACLGLIALDWVTSPRLVVSTINAVDAPMLDGDISDRVWADATPVTVLTRHGGDFGGSGESRIVVRAVRDDQNVYFALQWEDPTRSLKHLPLVKANGGWHGLETDTDRASEERFFDDRIAVMLASPGMPLIGGAIHLGERPLPDGPPSTTGRGLHFTDPGTWVDLWQWHAAVGAVSDRVEDGFVGEPLPPTEAQMAGEERYPGGLGIDDPEAPVLMSNIDPRFSGEGDSLEPRVLPRLASLNLGDVEPDAQFSDERNGIRSWALRASFAVPHTEAVDDTLPDGTVIPGVFVDDSVAPGAHDVTARGAWAGGHWILEMKRSLDAGPMDLEISDGLMLWFAVFDHAQTRHTYHLRPLIMEMP